MPNFSISRPIAEQFLERVHDALGTEKVVVQTNPNRRGSLESLNSSCPTASFIRRRERTRTQISGPTGTRTPCGSRTHAPERAAAGFRLTAAVPAGPDDGCYRSGRTAAEGPAAGCGGAATPFMKV
jgi:hypothetical protein